MSDTNKKKVPLPNPYAKKYRDDNPKPSKPLPKDHITGLDEYIRALYHRLPSGDDSTGTVHLNEPGEVGRAAKIARKNFSEATLQTYLDRELPRGAIHYTTKPDIRALKHKKPAEPTLLWQQVKADQWDSETMIKVTKEFEVPGCSRILLFFPRVFDRDILKKHSQYAKDDANGNKGVLTPCPWCKTNSHGQVLSKTGYKRATQNYSRLQSECANLLLRL